MLDALQRCLEAGSVVFDDGDPGRALFFIRSGEVELSRRFAGGARRVARLGPGQFFGEQGVLAPGPRRGSAVVTRDAELLEVEAAVFEEMCLERPDIALRIARAMAERAQALEQRLAGRGGEDGLRALVLALVRLSRPEGESIRVAGKLRDVAREAGLGLLEAHQALQQLVERKLVRLVDDVLQVPDLESLAASADA